MYEEIRKETETNATRIKDFSTVLNHINTQIAIMEHTKQVTESTILRITNEVAVKQDEVLNYKKEYNILMLAASTARNNAKAHFEKIVTDAIQFVTENANYSYVIDDNPGKSKAQYEFYVQTMVDGKPNKQKPEDAMGGGLIDIINVAMKLAYVQIFDDPKIKNQVIILDEPGKMISEQMSLNFAKYIKLIKEKFNKQVIMITHKNSFFPVADKSFSIIQDSSGYSRFTPMISSEDINSLNSQLKNMFIEEGDILNE